jgi:hypothetical protein
MAESHTRVRSPGACGVNCCRLTLVLAGLVILFGLSGCASVITSSYPAQEKVERGEVSVGPVVGYDYDLKHLAGNRFELTRTPLCQELVEKKKISMKQPRGVYAAVAEVPFFGLGLVDWVWADAIAQGSRRVELLGKEPTDKEVVCGDQAVAPNEKLRLQFPLQGQFETLAVDADGRVDLTPALKKHPNFSSVNVFVQTDSGLKYLTTLYR